MLNEKYKQVIHEMVDKIDDALILKRIYSLVEYLYIHKSR
jgi:hypothetical protein